MSNMEKRRPAGRSGGRPLPTQRVMWNPGNFADPGLGTSDGQWLYCLKNTEPGDRQLVWTGKHGDGIVAVVDFNGAVRPRSGSGRLYEGWGRITVLPKPIPPDEVLSHNVIGDSFRHLQRVSTLDSDAAEVIKEMIGDFPLAPGFDGHSEDWEDSGGVWGGASFDPEWITHEILAEEPEVAAELGFPSLPEIEKRLSPQDRADLWCPEGVVGEVKNVVTSRWGPDQIERYITTCDKRWPEHRWKGVLVQGEDYLTPSAKRRLEQSPYRDRISLWYVYEDPDDTEVILCDQLWPDG